MTKPLRVAIFPIPAIGHLNPALAIISAVTASTNAAVWTFAPADRAREIQAAGSIHIQIGNRSTLVLDRLSPLSELVQKTFLSPLEEMPVIVGRLAEVSPDVVLYDVFSLPGFMASRALGIRSASLVTFPGFGALGEAFVQLHGAQDDLLRAANDRYLKQFGVDVLGEGHLPVLFPSCEMSIVTASASLSKTTDANSTPNLHKLLAKWESTCRFVGPCLSRIRVAHSDSFETKDGTRVVPPSSRPPRIDRLAARFPFELLDNPRRRVVLFSLGTNLTDFRFNSPVGGAPTGRLFLLTMIRRLLQAFGDDPEVLLIVGTGALLDEDDEPRWPSNVIVRDFIPQLELLEGYVDVFITHHGASSTAESILAGVPMVSIPGVGDQLASAEMAVAAGAAVCLWELKDPYHTCDSARLRRAVQLALDDRRYHDSCLSLANEMREAGGAGAAARLLVAHATTAAPSA